MLDPLTITNAGKKVESRNYFDSEQARQGKMYFSVNAGCILMLLPDNMHNLIPEFQTGKRIIISRGPLPEFGREDSFEIMFDDASDNPFALHVGMNQWDMIPKKDNGWEFAIWTRQRCVLQKKCYYRVVESLPCLKPWG